MASDRRRPWAAGLLGVAAGGLTMMCAGGWRAEAAAPWWRPLGLSGTAVTAVAATGRTVLARTAAGVTWRSDDEGSSFSQLQGDIALEPGGSVLSGPDHWVVDGGGRVLHSRGGGPLRTDPGSPELGGSRLIAAPAAFPGVVVAVAADGTVWRRAQDGGWGRGLLLLPAGFPKGVPRVTSVAAFTEPLSGTVYLATDGYSVLNSTDGGDDWIRAGPGLPDAVYSLAADSSTRSVIAGTSDGVWVHELQTFPAPPVYRDAALVWRWVGIVLVSVLAALAAAVLLRFALATGQGR